MNDHQHDKNTAVLYNACCPVCSLEINHYARITEKNDLPIAFDDLNDHETLSAWGIDSETAARRLHVRKDGEILDGIPAFIALWREMPRYGWLASVVNTPGVYQFAVCTYDYILAPALYHWHLRRSGDRKRS